MSSSSRRDFVKSAALASGLAAGPLARPASPQGRPSDQINIGVVGIRGRGRDHYREFARIPGVRVAYLCDIDERLFARGVAEVEEIGGYKPETVVDIRELLTKDGLDAVSIATPDHWHALQTIWACQAHKDVYCEKPACFTIVEGRKMFEAARKYDRMVQIGLNRRSEKRVRSAVRYLQDEKFGPAYRARSVVYRGRASVGRTQEASIPKGVHWDLFLGPAPYRAFTLGRFHYGWHYYWDTATTELGNNGVHTIDVVRWALRKKVHPVKIHCVGGHFIDEDSDQQVPNVQSASFQYEDGTLVHLEATTLYSPTFGGVHMGEFFYTPNGFVGSPNNWEVTEGHFTPRTAPDSPAGVSNAMNNLSFPDIAYNKGPAIPDIEEEEVSHFQNFINCVRSRKREDLHCEVLEGFMSTSLAHLANIAFRTGRSLTFDPISETFPGDKEANSYLTRTYRAPFSLPDQV